ncbi:hypothetical protein ELE36_13030 [Pseudolysobacter antarcticus]|uniref:Uncharacterized protein n=1 Tax=Pseudolysobacter antarcticus TaxID=2511995 RepID=A0A411HL32_9GAMM|nr:hypothetical protein [Pseudolysobacter antarcticus]QBB71201.1 hypothetical protein ELE36_13030 [Pseudolysobacter antarcticus]
MREFGAHISIGEYQDIYWERQETNSKMKLPRAMDMAFLRDTSNEPDVLKIQSMIRRYDAEQATKLQQEIFAQRTRLADAERKLQTANQNQQSGNREQTHRHRQSRSRDGTTRRYAKA